MRMPRSFTLPVLIVAIVLAVMSAGPASADDGPPGTAGLAATSWRFVDAMDVAAPPDARVTLQFGADGAVSGSAGCNRYFGHYTAGVADEISFSQLGVTQMWCGPDLMALESAVLDAINSTGRVVANADRLELLAADGAVLAHLVPLVTEDL